MSILKIKKIVYCKKCPTILEILITLSIRNFEVKKISDVDSKPAVYAMYSSTYISYTKQFILRINYKLNS